MAVEDGSTFILYILSRPVDCKDCKFRNLLLIRGFLQIRISIFFSKCDKLNFAKLYVDKLYVS